MARPKCEICGKAMSLAGLSRAGHQRWRCRKNGQSCSHATFDSKGRKLGWESRKQQFSSNGRYPPRDELEQMLRTMTYREIGQACGIYRETVSKLVTRYGLVGISRHRSSKRPVEEKVVERMKLPETGWISKPMGRPFGGTGWHNMAGIEMARGQYA